jgi:hypothetical protein
MDSVTNSIRSFKELIPVLLKPFHKTEREGTVPNLLCEASISLIPKPDKNTTTKGNYRYISLNSCKMNSTTH